VKAILREIEGMSDKVLAAEWERLKGADLNAFYDEAAGVTNAQYRDALRSEMARRHLPTD
jgi:hypothetical protein